MINAAPEERYGHKGSFGPKGRYGPKGDNRPDRAARSLKTNWHVKWDSVKSADGLSRCGLYKNIYIIRVTQSTRLSCSALLTSISTYSYSKSRSPLLRG